VDVVVVSDVAQAPSPADVVAAGHIGVHPRLSAVELPFAAVR
jgi:hypothetical protein